MTLTSLFRRLFPPAPGTAAYARALAQKTHDDEVAAYNKNKATWAREFAESSQGSTVLEYVLKGAARGDTSKTITLTLDNRYTSLDIRPWYHPTVVGAQEYFRRLGYNCSYLSGDLKEGTATISVDW